MALTPVSFSDALSKASESYTNYPIVHLKTHRRQSDRIAPLFENPRTPAKLNKFHQSRLSLMKVSKQKFWRSRICFDGQSFG